MKFYVRDSRGNVLAEAPDHSSARKAFELLAARRRDALERNPKSTDLPPQPHQVVDERGTLFGYRERTSIKAEAPLRASTTFALTAEALAAITAEAKRRDVAVQEIVELAIRADLQPLLAPTKIERPETLKVYIAVPVRDRLVRAASAYRSTASEYGTKVLLGFVESLARRAA